jgi:hypothetical protein
MASLSVINTQDAPTARDIHFNDGLLTELPIKGTIYVVNSEYICMAQGEEYKGAANGYPLWWDREAFVNPERHSPDEAESVGGERVPLWERDGWETDPAGCLTDEELVRVLDFILKMPLPELPSDEPAADTEGL